MRLFLLVLALLAPGALAQTLAPLSFLPDEEAAPDDSLPFVEIFADGGVRSGVTGDSDDGAATGSLGVQLTTRLQGRPIGAAFTVSVIGASSQVESEYGASMLAPASGSTLDAGLAEARWQEILGPLDLRGYGSVATSDWSVPVGPDGLFDAAGTPETFGMGVLGGGLLVGKTLLSGEVATTKVAVVMDAGLSFRALFGDLSANANDSLRTSFLGTDDTLFGGAEIGLAIQVNGVKAALTFYQYAERDESSITGLTDGQVVAGIAVQAPIVSGQLRQ